MLGEDETDQKTGRVVCAASTILRRCGRGAPKGHLFFLSVPPGPTTVEHRALLLGRLLPRRKLLLFLTLLRAAFRSALGRRTRLLGCLRGHALRRGWLMVLLLLEHGALTLQDLWLLHWRRLLLEGTLALLRLWLLLLEDALPLQGLWLWYLWLLLLLESTRALWRLLLLLEGTLALLFLPLLELLLDLPLLLRLTVAVRFVLLSTPCRLTLHT